MFRTVVVILVTLAASLALLLTPGSAAGPFPETGYAVANAQFQDYFDHRGGSRVLGFPISREFDLLGSKVQFFQRAVLQLRPDGSVALLNILDEGLLPYTRVNGSTFPAPNPALTQGVPSPAEPDYAAKALDFVRANAPDNWEGMKTNFYSTFLNAVSYEEAFPKGEGDPGLLPLISLEIWGLPTSKPTYDPSNGNFVYLRFQRGIMHFDKGSGLTQGILIGDYLKAVMTGQNLPADLEEEAKGSKLYRQYNNSIAGGMNRIAYLPASDLFAAFEKEGVAVATPAPPTATAAPTAVPTPARPGSIQVVGDQWFVAGVNRALSQLSSRDSAGYAKVTASVYRIEQTTDSPSIDTFYHALKLTQADALPTAWRSWKEYQAQWVAGLIVHNATHMEQAMRGISYTTAEAEQEARLRQKASLWLVDTTPNHLFYDYANDAASGKLPGFGCWQQPRDPVVAVMPTPDAPVSDATATPTPVPVPNPYAISRTRPGSLQVSGDSGWFVGQTNSAVSRAGEPVRAYVDKIVQGSSSYTDIPNLTLYVSEQTAFPPGYRDNPDAQIQWYAGLLAHNATHMEQYLSGRPYTGLAAEQEARGRQKAAITSGTDYSNGRFAQRLADVINRADPAFACWEVAPAP